MKLLLIHSGHAFSTSDVYDGMAWGLRANGVEVVEYRWDRHLTTLNILAAAGVAQGAIAREKYEDVLKFMALLASADSLTTAVEHEVEAVLVINGILFPAQRAATFASIGLPVACYGTEAPYLIDRELHQAQGYTHWFTQERRCVKRFPIPTTYLPMAYHPEHHHPAPPDPAKEADLAFVGGGYPERKALWEGVNWTGIDARRFGTLWHLDALTPDADLSAGNIPNTETTRWHQSARIGLNLHRRMAEPGGAPIPAGAGESLGPRPYEIAACGTLLLSDDERPELRDVFGDSAATFRAWDAADLERQARYWLAHPDARDRRAAEQYAAVQPHHWGNRARTVLETLIP